MVAEPHRLVMSVEEYLTLDRNSLVSFPVAALYENVELPEDTPDSSSM